MNGFETTAWRKQRRLGAGGVVLAAVALLGGFDAEAAIDCTVSAAGVVFGTYDPAAAVDTDTAGNVTVLCNYLSGGAAQLSYTVSLSQGNSGTYASRQLRAGTSWLNYNLFTDLARTRTWGNGSAGTFVASGTFTLGPGVGNGTRQGLHTLYGRIPARQDALPGTYSDSIVLTLTF